MQNVDCRGLLSKKQRKETAKITQRGNCDNTPAFSRQSLAFPKPFYEERTQFQPLKYHRNLLYYSGLQRFSKNNQKRNEPKTNPIFYSLLSIIHSLGPHLSRRSFNEDGKARRPTFTLKFSP